MPLHPQSQAFLDAMAASKAPGWHELLPEDARKAFAGMTHLFGKGPRMHHVEDRILYDRLRMRVFRPSDTANLPVVLYFHGGGWVLGDLQTHDALCRHLAVASGCTIFSVDYRLAPEHPFPAALEDCYAATRYVAEHASGLGVDGTRIAVCGDSAGGNLAACVSLKARDLNFPRIDSNWLIYPAIAPQFDSASYHAFALGHGLTRETMRWFWGHYLKNPFDRNHAYAVPCRAQSLSGMPFTYVMTAEYDVLRDEGEIYATGLKRAGVPVTMVRYPGALHGFVHFAEVFDEGFRALEMLGRAMRQRFMSN
jgi:acetyl esterase